MKEERQKVYCVWCGRIYSVKKEWEEWQCDCGWIIKVKDFLCKW